MFEMIGRLPETFWPPLDWRRLFFGFALLVTSGIFTPAEAAFSNGYSFRREVDFVDAKVIGGPHTNFPVLIDSTLLYLRTTANGGKVENANGYDIIFTSDQAGAIQLAHEIERYDATMGEIVFWVRIESFAATISIYMFYGNSGIATFQGDVTSNGVTGVWDNDYVGVWHLNEDVVDEVSVATHFDATANNHDGIQQRNVEATGQIANGQDFDGTNDFIEDADGELYINGLTAFTLSLWIQSDIIGTSTGFIIGKLPDNDDDALTFRYDAAGLLGGGTNGIKASVTVNGVDQLLESSSNVQTTAWQYLSWSWSSGNQHTLYIDGLLDSLIFNDPAETGSLGGTDRLRIGQGTKSGETDWDGRIDETRLSSVVRGAAWIETEYNNQFSPATFYLLRAEDAQLVLVKRAFMTDGTPIADASTLPAGIPFDFMIYVNNKGDGVRTDTSIRDVLDPLFVYTVGTIFIDNSQSECALAACTAAEEASIRTAALATTVKTDIIDGDTVSFTGVTIDVGNQVIAGNAQQDADANKVLAIVFRVRMQ